MYINATADDGTEISELMKYFLNSDGKNLSFPKLSSRVDYFKNQRRGINDMCEFSEMLIKEGKIEVAERMKADKEPIEKIVKYSGLTVEEIEAL